MDNHFDIRGRLTGAALILTWAVLIIGSWLIVLGIPVGAYYLFK